MKTNKTKIAIAIIATLFSASSFAAPVKYQGQKTETIKGYYPQFASVGTKVVVGDRVNDVNAKLKVGDVIAIPSDVADDKYFNIKDKDLDLILDYTKNADKYQVRWFKVTPKSGYKWTDVAGTGTNVSKWADVDAVLIDKSFHADATVSGVKTSDALYIPPVVANQRIGFSIVPKTQNGDPREGSALFAPDTNYFWANIDENQLPGEPDPGTTDPTDPTGPGGGDKGGENNGGGGEVEASDPNVILRYYTDVNNNGVVDLGIDEVLTGNPTVNTTYLADVSILVDNTTGNGGDKIKRPLTESEKATIKWVVTGSDGKTSDIFDATSGRLKNGGLAFTTQATNNDAGKNLKALAPNFSEQGATIHIEFEYDNADLNGVNPTSAVETTTE